MYNSKIKAADIKWLNESEWSHEAVEAWGNIQPEMGGIQVGYHTPRGCNWSYAVVIAILDGEPWQVVTQHGCVVGGRQLTLKNYETEGKV